MENFQRKYLPFVSLVGLWAVYTTFYAVLRPYNIAGILSFIGEVGLDFLAIVFTFHLWMKCSDTDKNIFALFCISFFLAVVTDGDYNIVTYPLHKVHST